MVESILDVFPLVGVEEESKLSIKLANVFQRDGGVVINSVSSSSVPLPGNHLSSPSSGEDVTPNSYVVCRAVKKMMWQQFFIPEMLIEILWENLDTGEMRVLGNYEPLDCEYVYEKDKDLKNEIVVENTKSRGFASTLVGGKFDDHISNCSTSASSDESCCEHRRNFQSAPPILGGDCYMEDLEVVLEPPPHKFRYRYVVKGTLEKELWGAYDDAVTQKSTDSTHILLSHFIDNFKRSRRYEKENGRPMTVTDIPDMDVYNMDEEKEEENIESDEEIKTQLVKQFTNINWVMLNSAGIEWCRAYVYLQLFVDRDEFKVREMDSLFFDLLHTRGRMFNQPVLDNILLALSESPRVPRSMLQYVHPLTKATTFMKACWFPRGNVAMNLLQRNDDMVPTWLLNATMGSADELKEAQKSLNNARDANPDFAGASCFTYLMDKKLGGLLRRRTDLERKLLTTCAADSTFFDIMPQRY